MSRLSPVSHLSERERRVIEFAAEGLVDKEIAAALGISLATVRTYWDRIRIKLKAMNRVHVVAIYLRHTLAKEHEPRASAELSPLVRSQSLSA